MKGFRQIFGNKVTRNAIFFTIFILFIYRIGTNIVTPGVDNSAITGATVNLQVSTLFDFFGGGSLSQMGLFALGVSPYISASVMIQLLESDLVPAMSEWKNQGVEGQNKRNKWTKYLAIILSFVQGLGILIGSYITSKVAIVADPTLLGYLQVALLMTAGSAIVVWLSDRISELGIGNGMSVIICVGILSRVPVELHSIQRMFKGLFSNTPLPSIFKNPGGFFTTLFQVIKTNSAVQKQVILWAVIAVIFILLIVVIIYYTLAERRIPVNYVRGENTTAKPNSYLPIKLNPAGVIPIIFVQPFLIILGIIFSYSFNHIPYFVNNGHGQIEQFFLALTGNITKGQTHYMLFSISYIVVYGLLIIGFTMIYSSIQMNPEEMTKNLANQQAYILNTRPGEDTYNYLNKAIRRTSLWGGIALLAIAIIPIIMGQFISISVSLSLLGTGLIINVGVIVQVYQSLLNKSEKQRYRAILGE